MILAEIRDGLEHRPHTVDQPEHFNIAPRLAFEPSARTHLVQISVEIKLQQIPRIVRRPPRRFRLNLRKPQPCKVKAIHKGIYDPNRAIQRDHLVQCLRVKRRLITRLPNHVRHLAPESISASQNPAPKGGFCTAWNAGTTAEDEGGRGAYSFAPAIASITPA